MSDIRCHLVIRLDESKEIFSFSTIKIEAVEGKIGGGAADFPVEIDLERLRNLGAMEAERLIGKCVLGFFDHLTNGRLDLPKHYLDDSDLDD